MEAPEVADVADVADAPDAPDALDAAGAAELLLVDELVPLEDEVVLRGGSGGASGYNVS